MSAPTADIAGVVIDTGLLHLDRPFDYKIPEKLSELVHIGSHVRVRFAGRLVSGWVVSLSDASEHPGRLSVIERVVGSTPVVTEETIRLCRAVATRYIGTFADVLRTAVPPRHAGAERDQVIAAATAHSPVTDAGADEVQPRTRGEEPACEVNVSRDASDWLSRYPDLQAAIDAGERIAVTAGPAGHGHDVVAACAVRAAARGPVLVVVPNSQDIDCLTKSLRSDFAVADSDIVVLAAEVGRAQRWRAFGRVLRGEPKYVIGTRSAVFAPIPKLGTIIVWDDTDDSHRELHAPYWHSREVAALRAHEQNCGLIVCGLVESVESAALVERGWLRRIEPQREWLRSVAPRVLARTDAEHERDPWAAATTVPAVAVRQARDALESGPVLVLTPRRGYARLAWCRGCARVRECSHCGDAARVLQDGLFCVNCAAEVSARCRACGETAFRAAGIGQERIAEEMGRALPGVHLIISNADKRVTATVRRPALVFATAGCEPVADRGYAAVIILDVASLLSRAGSDAEIAGLRQMMRASSLARPGAGVVVAAEAGLAAVQSLVRWDPSGYAERALSERANAHLAPAARMFVLTGAADDLLSVLHAVSVPQPADIINPHEVPGGSHRMVISVPWQRGAATAASLREVLALRQASHAGGAVQVRVDPHTL
ncbi:MAG: hypothetical protein EB027_00630 [Actinobacteria bacterium]|nr:hypothetical protein [Actinomycetota bacterium]